MPKRLISDRPVEDTNEDDQGVKRRKTRHIKSAMEDLIELLDPATSGSLADFNAQEESKNRWGVVGLDAFVFKVLLKELAAARDAEAMDTKINEIDTSLEMHQGAFRDYINQQEDDVVHRHVLGTLGELITRIEAGRRQLPGIPPYWMNCYRKANC